MSVVWELGMERNKNEWMKEKKYMRNIYKKKQE